ncbi:MAG: GNAT family N-acetyltransferase [Sulfitobacter sp.]
MHLEFDPQPVLQDDTLLLRPLRDSDLEPLYDVAKDPAIWAGHPAKDRHQRTVFSAYFTMLLASQTTLAITLAATGQVIGCSRYYTPPEDAHSIAIGYTFLGRDWWGGPSNFAMKSLMLAHAFAHVDTVWLHIDPANIRSQRATAKLGAICAHEGPMQLNGKDGVWQSWRLDRGKWEQVVAAKQ